VYLRVDGHHPHQENQDPDYVKMKCPILCHPHQLPKKEEDQTH